MKIAHRMVRLPVPFLRHILTETLYQDMDMEPASALATKISRAHDNPSPPPQMQPLGPENDNPTFPTSTELRRLSNPAALKDSGPAVAGDLSPGAQAPIPSSSSHDPPTSLGHKPDTSLPANVSVDLIAFDDEDIPGVPKAAVRRRSAIHVSRNVY
jgi:hypothetical protein